MHWFWRGAIAVVAAMLFAGLPVWQRRSVPGMISHWIHQLLPPAGPFASYPAHWGSILARCVAYGATIALAALGSYALVTRCFGLECADSETRCRKCNHILRGITEPRCPECGERI